jgi:CRP-like cAMP-binding protein
VPPRAVRVHKTGKRAVARRKKARIAQRQRAMRCLDFFGHLSAEVLRRLATRARTRMYAALEIIIQQGDQGEELFVLESGEAVVSVASPGEAPIEVARLNPGNFFGEMSALTGEPRRATVRASRECEVLVIGKAALAEVFASAPDVAEQVSRTIVQRQEKLSAQLSEHESPPAHAVAENTHRLLQRIKHFFSM